MIMYKEEGREKSLEIKEYFFIRRFFSIISSCSNLNRNSLQNTEMSNRHYNIDKRYM